SVHYGNYAYKRKIEQVLFSPGNKNMLLSYSNGLLRLYDIVNGNLLQEKDLGQDVGELSYKPDGKELAGFTSSYGSRFVNLLDATTLEKRLDLFRNERGISSFYHDRINNRLWFARTAGKQLHVFDMKTSRLSSL